jgi:hypothetical protein
MTVVARDINGQMVQPRTDFIILSIRTMPAEFDLTPSTGCGSVLMWTR